MDGGTIPDQNPEFSHMPPDMIECLNDLLPAHGAVEMTLVNSTRERESNRRGKVMPVFRDAMQDRALPARCPSATQGREKRKTCFVKKYNICADSTCLFLCAASRGGAIPPPSHRPVRGRAARDTVESSPASPGSDSSNWNDRPREIRVQSIVAPAARSIDRSESQRRALHLSSDATPGVSARWSISQGILETGGDATGVAHPCGAGQPIGSRLRASRPSAGRFRPVTSDAFSTAAHRPNGTLPFVSGSIFWVSMSSLT